MKTIKETLELALEALEETRNALAWFYDSYPQDVTKKGNELLPHVETVLTALREALAEQPAQQEPVGCEGAIVNGRVYADRLEHDYKFECEAGPLHLCTDWVEFRRCFEWLAQHTSPPAQQEPLEYWNAVEGWVKIDEVRKHFDSVGCGTIYKTAGDGRVPLTAAQRKPLTDDEIWREYRFLWPFHPAEERKLASDILIFARAIEAVLKAKNSL